MAKHRNDKHVNGSWDWLDYRGWPKSRRFQKRLRRRADRRNAKVMIKRSLDR